MLLSNFENLTMESLTCLSQIHSSLPKPNLNIDGEIHFTVDPLSKNVYVGLYDETSQTFEIFMIHNVIQSNSSNSEIRSIEVFPNDDTRLHIVSLQWIIEQDALFIAFKGGNMTLLKYHESNNSYYTQHLGDFTDGIECISWSPDEELFALITGHHNVTLLTQDFEPLFECPLHTDDKGENKSVSVGWGKKETQFHGSAGKQEAQKKLDTSKFNTSPHDDKKIHLTWSADARNFCCSSIDPQYNRRVLRIFSRTGTLQNVSEALNQLEHSISWKPNSNLIASSQLFPHKHDVVFIERNGLKHGDFSLRNKDFQMIDLTWNLDSRLLALHLNNSGQKFVQIWSDKNYHWYLKYEISNIGDVSSMAWDSEDPLVLHIFTQNGKYWRYEFIWDIFGSFNLSESETSTIGVIDGEQLLITPFKFANIPPPMSFYQIQSPKNLTSCCFYENATELYCATLSQDNVIQIYQSFIEQKGLVNPTLLQQIDMSDSPFYIRQMTFLDDNILFCLCYSENDQCDVIIRLYLTNFNISDLDICYASVPFHRIKKSLFDNRIICQSSNKSLFEIVGNLFDPPPQIIDLKYQNDLLETSQWSEFLTVSDQLVPIYRNRKNKLFFQNHLLSPNCSSFYLTQRFLIFTTLDHFVKFIPLSFLTEIEGFLSDLDISNIISTYELNRKVERGTKIVLAPNHGINLVLQMPRGNLETIFPRALAIDAISRNIRNLQFRDAFLCCRKLRVDMNLIYDFDPVLFETNLDLFLQQVNVVDHLNLFISSLKNEDVTFSMYRNHFFPLKQNSDSSSKNKINHLCDLIREKLFELNQNKYLYVILCTYFKKNPPAIPEALGMIRRYKDQNLEKVEDALKYAIFLCDVEKLYKTALGLYDLSLALLIAQQSQMDPREYLAFLSELQPLSPSYQKFKIDDHLRRYDKALQHLYESGESYYENCVTYVQKHGLYRLGLHLFQNQSDHYKIIAKTYGDHLFEIGNLEDAMLVFTQANEYQAAILAAKRSKNWKFLFFLLGKIEASKSMIYENAIEIADIFLNDRDYNNAAQILLNYTDRKEEAINAFLKGHHWEDAIQTIYLTSRQDLIEEKFEPALIEAAMNHIDTLHGMINQLSAEVNRLSEVRKNPIVTETIALNEDVDVMSDTSSMASQFSRYTVTNSLVSASSTSSGKTAKSRRKQERSRLRGKKGSIYEEEYLVNSIKKLIDRFHSLSGDIKDLMKFLITQEQFNVANRLQTLLIELRFSFENEMVGVFDKNILEKKSYYTPDFTIPKLLPEDSLKHILML